MGVIAGKVLVLIRGRQWPVYRGYPFITEMEKKGW